VASTRDYIGNYRLIKLIRSGQTCHVWEAIQDGERDRVALKVLLEKYHQDKELIEQLRHEAEVGKTLNHPDVIKIFDFSSKHRLPYIAMQLYNARNLKQELREKPQYVAVNIPEIIEHAAIGLAHMHSKGWVHCDVKPDNFLCDENANLKLIDFSISRKASKGGLAALFSRPKTLQGTRSYMAPEQIRRKAITYKTDQYGLGCTLFELMAGRPPFTGSTPDELLQKHISSQAPSVQVHNKAVSEDVAKLIMKLMAKSPADRFADLDEFIKHYKHVQVYRAGMRPKA
jgi:eukaryotic-like serine/threonine-protein kinase